MKKFLMCLLLIAAILLCAGCAGSGETPADKKPGNSSSGGGGGSNSDNKEVVMDQLIASVGTEGVTVVIGKIEPGRYGDSAPVTAQVPNYTELFAAACKAEDPTEALARAIEKKTFTTVEYTGYVSVSYDGETPVYNTDKLVQGFIEKELIKAINAVLESEAAA